MKVTYNTKIVTDPQEMEMIKQVFQKKGARRAAKANTAANNSRVNGKITALDSKNDLKLQ